MKPRCSACGWLIVNARDNPGELLCGCTTGFGWLFPNERVAAWGVPLILCSAILLSVLLCLLVWSLAG